MSDHNKVINLGFVGCGRVTETRHLPALRKLTDAKVIAIADIDDVCVKRVADSFGISRCYSSLQDLLKDPDIEAVAVCVPAQFHVELSLAVLEAGKHLFVEKPLALSLDESERLQKAASHSRQVIMVGFNLRWHRLVRQARRILQEGKLGKLKMVNSSFTSGSRNRLNFPEWRKKRQSGGGVLIEQAVHHFDLWRNLLQSEVHEVFVKTENEDETAIIAAQMEDGTLVTSAFSEGTADNNEFHFYGRSARLYLNCYRFDGLQLLPTTDHAGDFLIRVKSAASVLKHIPQMVKQFRHGGDYVASYKNEWCHFIDCIQKGVTVESTVEDGHRSLQILMAALESASLNQPVKVVNAPRTIRPLEATQ